MFKEVSRLLWNKSARLSLLGAGMLALVMLVAGPSSASAATGEITTTYWKNGSTQGYSIEATVNVSPGLPLATVTMTGPQISTSVELVVDSTNTTSYSASIPLATSPVVGANYTVTVDYLDNSAPTPTPTEVLTVPITGLVDKFAVPVAPVAMVASSAAPTFTWTAPTTMPANFSVYNLSLTGPDLQWNQEGLTQLTVPYSGTVALAPAIPYQWSIFVVDSQGNRSETRASFVLGVSFTGKVTDINGTGIAGASVNVTDDLGNEKGTVTTQADGSYVYCGLSAGKYKVMFITDNASAYYLHNLGTNALYPPDLLQVTTGVVTTGVNAVLGGWGAITGSVFVTGSALPTTGVQVSLYDANRVLVASVPAVTILTGTSTFERFYLSLIKPGIYYVKYSAPGFPDRWSDAPVTVNTDKTVGVNFTNGIPTITSFSLPVSSASLTVSGISMAARELGSGIAGFMLTESSTPPAASAAGWSALPPTSFTVAGSGVRTLYAWAKGNSTLVSTVTSISTKSVTITVSRTLTVQNTGTGSGSVNSNPSGIACATGSSTNCSASFAGGTVVTLTPTASSSSVFSGWTGACTGTGNCQVSIDANKTVTAGFTIKPATVRIDGIGTAYYNIGGTLDTVITAGKTVRVKSGSFIENVLMTSPVAIALKGGYTDDAFSLRTGPSVTVVDGTLKIRSGRLNVERVVVR
jgi:hypothetical protein